jgi:hypothetical protein
VNDLLAFAGNRIWACCPCSPAGLEMPDRL